MHYAQCMPIASHVKYRTEPDHDEPAAMKKSRSMPSHDEIWAMYAENWAAEADALRERLIFLCESLAPTRGRYEYLESRTAISSSKWKNVFLGRQMPTIEMLVAMCHYRRDHALWLMTGTATNTGPLGADHAPSQAEWDRFTAHRAWVKERKAGGDQEG
jgi:hypothetical protein